LATVLDKHCYHSVGRVREAILFFAEEIG
jgi:hypothetical protein